MFKIYDGKVYAVQEEETDCRALLPFFLGGVEWLSKVK